MTLTLACNACNVGYKQTEAYFTVALTVNHSKLGPIPNFDIMSLLAVLIFFLSMEKDVIISPQTVFAFLLFFRKSTNQI